MSVAMHQQQHQKVHERHQKNEYRKILEKKATKTSLRVHIVSTIKMYLFTMNKIDFRDVPHS